jgi:hypothetical protein
MLPLSPAAVGPLCVGLINISNELFCIEAECADSWSTAYIMCIPHHTKICSARICSDKNPLLIYWLHIFSTILKNVI